VIVGGIEVEENDDGEIAGLIVSARLRKAEAADVASAAGGAASTIAVRGPVGGGRWISGSSPRTSKPRCRGSAAHRRPAIDAALTNELSNARLDSVTTKLRLLTRIAFRFRAVDALIGLAMLSSVAAVRRSPAEPDPQMRHKSPKEAPLPPPQYSTAPGACRKPPGMVQTFLTNVGK
jgi:hypothetical protein